MMDPIRLYLFGAPRLERTDKPVHLPRRKGLALLVYLVVTARLHSRDALAALLWPEFDSSSARANLRRELFWLRDVLGEATLDASRDQIGLASRVEIWTDTRQFQSLLAQAKAHDHRTSPGAPPCPTCLGWLTQAVNLYSADFMAGFSLPDSPAFDEWQFFQSENLRQGLSEALQQLTEWNSQAGDHTRAVEYCRRWLALDPLHEPAHRRLMAAYAAAGQQSAAIRQYQECVRVLQQELGVEPEEETKALYQAIRSRQYVPAEPAQQHREIAPIARPQPQPYNLLEEKPGLAPIYNLPAVTTSLVGRQAELESLVELLSKPEVRLVTMVGLGGVGKTILAISAGQRLQKEESNTFAGGIVFVPLLGLETGENLPTALANALRLLLAGQVDTLTEVTNFLAGRKLLIILDNFEQLLDGSDQLNHILEACPQVKLLVTSRELLRLQAEWRFDLEGLPYPPANLPEDEQEFEGLQALPSVQLFLQTAEQMGIQLPLSSETRPHVYELCRLVSGIPLAIRLAAAWLRVMPIQQISSEVAKSMDLLTSRLRDTPSRHRSMRVIFESSWEMLKPEEQRAFQALSVFKGGFSQEAARMVAGIPEYILADLADRGLVQPAGEGRYTMHELTRQFAGGKLITSDPQNRLPVAHNRYYLDLIAGYEALLFGNSPCDAIAALHAEIDNIRQAWHWAVIRRQVEIIDASLEAMAAFYEFTGLLAEGEKVFGLAHQYLKEPQPSPLAARLLLKQIFLGIGRQNVTHLEDSINAFAAFIEPLEDDALNADLLLVRGYASHFRGNFAAGIPYLQLAAERYLELGRHRMLIDAWLWLGEAMARSSQPDEAISLHRRALRLAEEDGDLRRVARALSYMGGDYFFLDDYQTSHFYFKQAAKLFEELNYLLGSSQTLNNIGFIDYLLGNYDEAMVSIRQSLEMYRQIGSKVFELNAKDSLADVLFELGDYEQARMIYVEVLNRLMENRQQLESAWLLGHLARLEAEIGEYSLAEARLFQAREILASIENQREEAAVTGELGCVYRRWGLTPQAHEFLDKSIAALRHIGGVYALSHLLVEKGILLLEGQKPGEAEQLAQEALEIAQSIGRKPVIFQARLVLAQAAHALGREEEALLALEELCAAARLPHEEAEARYLLWRLAGDEEQGRQALAIFNKLAEKTQRVLYLRRSQELQESRIT